MSTIRNLVILTVVLVSAALFFWMRQSKTYDHKEIDSTESKVFEGIDIEKVNRIVITNRYDTLSFVHKENEWLIEERGEYLADKNRINQLLIIMADLLRVQKTSMKKADFAVANLEDPVASKSDTTGGRIDLYGSDGSHFGLIAGEIVPSQSEKALMFGIDHDGRNLFRLINEDDVYMADRSLRFLNTLPWNWMKNPICLPNAYRRISYYEKGEWFWTLSRGERGEPYLLGSPAGHDNVKVANITDDIDYLFSGILIKDIMPESFSKTEVEIDGNTYCELEALNGDIWKVSFGSRIENTEQEMGVNQAVTGFFRPTTTSSQIHLTLTWPNGRKEPPMNEPPYGNRVYLAAANNISDFLLTAEELIVFNRMRPQAQKQPNQNQDPTAK